MSHYVFAESNTTGTGQLAVERLRARGHRVTFMTRDRSKYPFLTAAAPGLEVLDVETNDPAELAAAVAGLRARAGIDALLTFSDFYVAIVAQAAAELGFPYLAPEPARICRDKFLTRQALRRQGLPTPDFWLLGSADEAERLGRSMRYPCVVKPPADSSSFGVKVVSGARELERQFRRLNALTANVRGQRLDGSVLVESLLEGPEYSVETLSLPDGALAVIGVTDKHLSSPPFCVETGHDFPSRADAAVQESLIAAVRQGLQAVGFDLGPAHTEVRWTASGPVIVEINPRLAGGMIPELVRYATGIDLLDAMLELARGHTPALRRCRNEFAAVRFLTVERGGRIVAVRGLELARALPEVREIALAKGIGTRVQSPENAYHRLGFVIAAGADRGRVIAGAQRARALIAIEVEDEEPVAASVRELAS